MEAYDAAVLSYALATAATKIKPGLLGLGPMLPAAARLAAPAPETESLTPPARKDNGKEAAETSNHLHQLLGSVEQQVVNKIPVQVPQLLEICSTKPAQVDQQVIAYLDALQGEVRQICKNKSTEPTQQLLLHLNIDENEALLNTEIITKSLSELLKQFGFVLGANLLKKNL